MKQKSMGYNLDFWVYVTNDHYGMNGMQYSWTSWGIFLLTGMNA